MGVGFDGLFVGEGGGLGDELKAVKDLSVVEFAEGLQLGVVVVQVEGGLLPDGCVPFVEDVVQQPMLEVLYLPQPLHRPLVQVLVLTYPNGLL